jgi:hypothetical protein
MFGADKPGEIRFEPGHVRAQAKRTVVERAINGSLDFRAKTLYLGRQIEIRNGSGHNMFGMVLVDWKQDETKPLYPAGDGDACRDRERG